MSEPADIAQPRFTQTISLAAFTAGGLAVAFFTQWYTVYVLGAGRATDALFAGSTIPQLVFAIVTGSLMHVLVPIFSGEEVRAASRDAWRILSTIAGVIGIGALVLIATAGLWAHLIAPGFDIQAEALLVKLTRIQLLGMVFTAASGVLSAFCNSRGLFVRVVATQFAVAALSFALLVVTIRTFGVTAAAWLSVARYAGQCFVLLPALGRPSSGRTSAPLLQETWKRLRPLAGGAAYYRTDIVLDRVLSSMAAAGALSLYSLAQLFYSALTQLANSGLIVPIVPLLSTLYKRGDDAGFARTVRSMIVQFALLAALVAGAVAVGRPLLDLVIGRGGITHENVQLLWQLMFALTLTFAGGVIGQATSASFYARGDTRTPTRIGVICFTIYVPLKVVAFLKFGLIGMALANGAFLIASALWQGAVIRRAHAL